MKGREQMQQSLMTCNGTCCTLASKVPSSTLPRCVEKHQPVDTELLVLLQIRSISVFYIIGVILHHHTIITQYSQSQLCCFFAGSVREGDRIHWSPAHSAWSPPFYESLPLSRLCLWCMRSPRFLGNTFLHICLQWTWQSHQLTVACYVVYSSESGSGKKPFKN